MAPMTKFTSIMALGVVLFCGQAPAAETIPSEKLYPCDGDNYMRFAVDAPPLMPMPQKVDWKGKALAFKEASVSLAATGKQADSEQMKLIVKELGEYLKSHHIADGTGKEALAINFSIADKDLPGVPADRQDEAYLLSIADGKVTVTARSTKGLYYGYQTLKQLIVRRNGVTTVPVCSITDYPDYAIRGFMNDVGRNYLPIDLIHKEIDAMARAKMNVYHFHFTEGEGWRLESKIFPQLNDAKHFTRFPGKYYTQQEFKDLVEYCRLRNITVVPEMDMPGHSAAFRRAMGITKMEDPRATEALEKLIAELASLVPADKMPYIHIGTDEARGPEVVSKATVTRYFAAVEKAGRKAIRWQPGIHPDAQYKPVEQLWMGRQARHAWPSSGAEYIDSQENYTNHLDPFEAAMTYFFRRPCPYQGAKGLGGFVCSFPDLPMTDSSNHLTQNPNLVSIAAGGEGLWNGVLKFTEPRRTTGKVAPMADEYFSYFSNLPLQGDPALEKFARFEDRLVALRDRFSWKEPFNYVRQSNIPWKIVGPFPHGGKTDTSFSPEEMLKTGKVETAYTAPDGGKFSVHKEIYTGATIIFKHYCDFPTLFNKGKMGAHPGVNTTYYATTYIYSPKEQDVPFWISGQTWPTSDWRNGPVSVPGKWFHADTKFWVNGKEIAPPVWKTPNQGVSHVDHNYQYREPTMIRLNKGWNHVLVKAPNNKSARRWMFTFVPVQPVEGADYMNVREYPGLKFSVNPQ